MYLHYLSGRKPPSKPKKELQNAFVFPIRKRESSKVKKGNILPKGGVNLLLLTPNGKGKETILKVNVRYIKDGELDHVSIIQ